LNYGGCTGGVSSDDPAWWTPLPLIIRPPMTGGNVHEAGFIDYSRLPTTLAQVVDGLTQ
jgi:hypothetical protein